MSTTVPTFKSTVSQCIFEQLQRIIVSRRGMTPAFGHTPVCPLGAVALIPAASRLGQWDNP